MDLTSVQLEWLKRMQREWFQVMKPFSLTEGWSDQYVKRGKAFTPIPKLSRIHLANAKLVPSREELLNELPRGGIGGEVGTQHGYFAKKLADNLCPVELHLFDLSFDSFDSVGLLANDGRVTKHVGDSAEQLSGFPAGYFDWLYIDANHSYAGVKRDLGEATRVVKKSGFLAFNDFTYWSPLEAMDYGVAHAVCELCIEQNWEIIFFALEPWMYCDVVIRRWEN
jgi:hypothetical protein